MKHSVPLAFGIFLSTMMLVAEPANAAPDSCKAIHFKTGSFSATVQGSVDPNDVRCYSIATARGQTADLAIQSKNSNTIFSIDGLVDAQDRYRFTTEKKTYKILVGQLMKAAEKDQFTLTITIR